MNKMLLVKLNTFANFVPSTRQVSFILKMAIFRELLLPIFSARSRCLTMKNVHMVKKIFGRVIALNLHVHSATILSKFFKIKGAGFYDFIYFH